MGQEDLTLWIWREFWLQKILPSPWHQPITACRYFLNGKQREIFIFINWKSIFINRKSIYRLWVMKYSRNMRFLKCFFGIKVIFSSIKKESKKKCFLVWKSHFQTHIFVRGRNMKMNVHIMKYLHACIHVFMMNRKNVVFHKAEIFFHSYSRATFYLSFFFFSLLFHFFSFFCIKIAFIKKALSKK